MNLPRARTQERRFSHSLNFSLDSRNENLPEKHIHRNYALTTVPMSPRSRIGTKSPFMPAAGNEVAATHSASLRAFTPVHSPRRRA